MQYEEFKMQLSWAGLSVREFAEHIGVSANTVTNYASREQVPRHFAVIVTLMAHIARNGLDPSQPLTKLQGMHRRKQRRAKAIRPQKSLF